MKRISNLAKPEENQNGSEFAAGCGYDLVPVAYKRRSEASCIHVRGMGRLTTSRMPWGKIFRWYLPKEAVQWEGNWSSDDKAGNVKGRRIDVTQSTQARVRVAMSGEMYGGTVLQGIIHVVLCE